jgi:hypothetical protein
MTAVGVGAIFLAGCAQDSQDEWTTEVWPESTVQPNYCKDMPHDDLEAPEVLRKNEDTWAINYPAFREGCGAYQLSGQVIFPTEGSGESYYGYSVTVCNRCKNTHAIYALRRPVNANLDLPTSLKELPKSPRVESLDHVPGDAGPVVEHIHDNDVVLQENLVCREPTTGADHENPVITYEEIRRFELAPDEFISEKVHGTRLQFSGNRLTDIAESGATSSRLRWPIVRPLDGPVDGRIAASRTEYCVVTRESDSSGSKRSVPVTRAYEVPYDADKKYATQTVSPPQLPDALVKHLNAAAEE